ncbi:DUF4917 family protein [Ahrensia kielensis]|uniref:DUF4917 family protein n=1 Tax=Ahrensia kielensis TaxID=76980 RepID=A0ABU9T5C3_9HYPH
MKILTFQEAIDASQKYTKRHLLLGNGFSIACKPQIFTYGSLFSEAMKKMSKELIAVFEALKTRDFEEVIKALQNASAIITAYNPRLGRISKLMNTEAVQLKNDLINAIAGTHPARPNEITDNQYQSCREFLSNFIGEGRGGKVYTLNYDLLLYWALMHEERESPKYISLHHDDGFRKDQEYLDAEYVEWQGEGASHGQNIHYLHGALHLFDAGHQLQKYTWVNTGRALVDQANEALKKDAFPLFVAEGNFRAKQEKIQHSAYLHHNLKSFAGTCTSATKKGKALFIFGHSLHQNDFHILKFIGAGKINHLFISIFGDENDKENKKMIANVNEIIASRPRALPTLEVDYFDANSAHVWG